MKKYGLIGEKLPYSYSKTVHKALGAYEYDVCEVKREDVVSFVSSTNLLGFNVTVPYKKTVLPLMDTLDETALLTGAVNTVVKKEGAFYGANTDLYGIYYALCRAGCDPAGKSALILGTGGFAASAAAVLKRMGANVAFLSRTGKVNYQNYKEAPKTKEAQILINATPIGTYPQTDASPVEVSGFTNLSFVLDATYNPAKTRLLLQAKERKIAYVGGLPVLAAQAAASAELFTGELFERAPLLSRPYSYPDFSPCEAIERAIRFTAEKTANVVLIGMAGAGKTTVGRLLADKLKRPFVDTDEVIYKRTGKSAEEIFLSEGEEAFRKAEEEAVKEYAKKSGYVIATGGGAVLLKENRIRLTQNGVIAWLKRDLALLETAGRPLYKSGETEKLFRVREPLYAGLCDFAVLNDGAPQAAAEKIAKAFKKECEKNV